MSKQTVNHQEAMLALESAWASVEEETISPPTNVAQSLESILRSTALTFKYILVTGILAKYINPSVHPRALQVGSNLSGAYDARSLCHKVVVSFEKSKGNLFGLANEPFLNKPARHKEHDRLNPLRNRRLAATLHDVLDDAHHASSQELFKMLVYILRVAKQLASTITAAEIDTDKNYLRVINFVNKFLSEPEGGTRLVAVTGTFLSLLNQQFHVKVYSPNVPDKFAQTAGDIEIWDEQKLISATECKHRPVTLDDIRHGIRKAKENGVPEYCFTFADGLESGQESAISSEIVEESKNLDVIIINIYEAIQAWSSALNPTRRAVFGAKIVEILRQIRQFETANTAAKMWNEL